MAVTTLTIETKLQGGSEAVKSLSDLKKEFKDVQKELTGLTPGTEQYINTLKKLGAVKDEIGDLKDEISAFAGQDAKIGAVTNAIGGIASGFQAAQGAAALFGGENEDLQKSLLKVQSAMAFTEGIKGIAGLGDSFKVLGNVIKSNPLFLITTIVTGIGVALFALKDKISIVGKAFDFLGGILNTVVESVKSFTDWIGISSFEADKAHKKLMENAEAAKTAITERYDAEIRAAKRAGKETEEIEESKIRNLYLQNFKQIKALQERGAQRTDEENKQLIELVNKNKEYYQQLLDLEDAQNDKILQKRKEADAKDKERQAKKLADDIAAAEKWRQEQQKFNEYSIEALSNKYGEEEQLISKQRIETKIALGTATTQEIEAYNAYKLEQTRKQKEEEDAILKEISDRENKRREENNKKIADEYNAELQRKENQIAIHKRNADFIIKATLESLTVAQQLTDAFADKSVASQKKAFNIKKAASIAQATIETYLSAQSAFASQVAPGDPSSPIRGAIAAGVAVASGLARVANIAKQKFETPSTGGGGGGETNTNLGTFTQGGGGAGAPQGVGNTLTQLNPNGTVGGQQTQAQSQGVVKAYVVESESRAVTDRVNKLSEQSKIG